MKLRLVHTYKQTRIYCPNGTIINATTEDVIKFLTSFKKVNRFKGNDGYWNNEVSDIEDAPGITLAFVDDTNKLIIINESVFDGILKENTRYISASEYAELHGKSKAIVKRICADGRIEGAYKTSSGWLIPNNAPYPKDERFGNTKRSSKPKQSEHQD